jgi:protein-L-isoaspartate O-methyltransferase
VDLDYPVPDAALLRKYRIRFTVFLVAVIVVVALLSLAYKGINSVYVLDVVEAERDQWQKASEVIFRLNLKRGDVVADVGSGAGYFSLKLSQAVGPSGTVVAVDVCGLPLQAFSAGMHNIRVRVGQPNDPNCRRAQLTPFSSQTHITNAPLQNRCSTTRFKSFRLGGRLVVMDRSPTGDQEASEAEHHHQISPGVVEAQRRRTGLTFLNERMSSSGDLMNNGGSWSRNDKRESLYDSGSLGRNGHEGGRA